MWNNQSMSYMFTSYYHLIQYLIKVWHNSISLMYPIIISNCSISLGITYLYLIRVSDHSMSYMYPIVVYHRGISHMYHIRLSNCSMSWMYVIVVSHRGISHTYHIRLSNCSMSWMYPMVVHVKRGFDGIQRWHTFMWYLNWIRQWHTCWTVLRYVLNLDVIQAWGTSMTYVLDRA